MTANEAAIVAARGMGWIWRLAPSGWLLALAVTACIVLRAIPLYLPEARNAAATVVRESATAELLRSDPGAAGLTPSELEVAAARWMMEHAETLTALERQAEQSFRDALTFQGDDGERHVYLGDEDGYYWLQLARSVLARGTVCDRIERGECIDALANAPVGQAIEYVHSPHVYAIAAAQRLMNWLKPGFPLSSTAMLVPMALSALMMIPAFLVAERVSNRFGGLMAALLLSFNSVVLLRTGDGDDDIWTVALPIFAMALITGAFAGRSWSARLSLSGLGGIFLGLLAAAWKGWPLFALATLAGLIALAAWALLTAMIARARRDPHSYDLASSAGLCTLSSVAGFAVTAWLLQVPIDLGLIGGGVSGIFGHTASPPGPIDTAPLPNVFQTVGELIGVDAARLQQSMGPIATGLGLLGFALALSAPSRPRPLVVLALVVLLPIAAALVGHYGSGRAPVLAIPALLGLAAAIANWLGGKTPADRAAVTGILGTAWLGATLWMSFDGLRFVILAIVPLSLSAGISLGHVTEAIASTAAARPRLAGAAGVLAAGGLGAAALGPVAVGGLAEASHHAPTINRAWTDAFATIRAQSSRDAIIDIWWDYGHWAKYFTEREVVLDGASLQNQAVHWMARALAATSDTEAQGLLRMMNCGRVDDPDGGSSARPYNMLLRWSADPGLAFRSFMEMARQPREQAAVSLRSAGLPDRRAAALLQASYCTPPQSFLVLTTDLLYSRGWLLFGMWDPGLAHIVELARRGTADAALPVIEQKYGLSEAAARSYYEAASRVRTEQDEIAFATPGAQVWSRDWQPCAIEGGALRCPLDLGDFALGPHLQDVVVDSEHPERTRIRMLPRPEAAAIEARPALVEIARPDQLQDVPLPDATVGLAVLVDPEQKRVFVGTPRVLHSMLVRLSLLDGRYSPQFQKIYDQLGIDRQRVTAWRILWGQP